MINDLENFKTYNKSMEFAEKVWTIVRAWNFFDKDTIGKQLVRSSDSIGANLSEGLGRYHFKETKNFAYYARGSLFESKTWLTKSFNRRLITEEQFESLIQELDVIGKMINGYISSIGIVEEPMEIYGSHQTSLSNTQPPAPVA